MRTGRASRRTLLQAALAGAGALTGGLLARRASAASTAVQQDTALGQFWSAEYWAHHSNIALYLYRKRVSAPQPGESAQPVLLLLHGSSISARPSFDLSVPGSGEYSLMNVCAAAGFDTWTLDFQGYGRSSHTDGNSDIAAGVSDLKAAVQVIARETGQGRYHFLGESSGALRAGAFAMAAPEQVGRLVLGALTYTGKGSPTLAKRAEQAEYYRTHNRRKRDATDIRGIFTRDQPGTSEPAAVEALVAAELPFGDSVPTGTYLDMSVHLPVIQPGRILSPTLIVRGQYDGIATLEDLLDFYQRLPNPDRQLAILPNVAHTLALAYNRRLFWRVALNFLQQPRPLPLLAS